MRKADENVAHEGRLRNELLRRLPESEYDPVAARLRPVDVRRRDVVYVEGEPLEMVYFPVTCVFSFVDAKTAIEVRTVGNEGVAGLPAFLGALISPHRGRCEVPGRALALSVAGLRDVGQRGSLRRILRAYTQATIVELAQNVTCAHTHTPEQRAARWVLTTRDRVGSDEFRLSVEFLARMLGVRRGTASSGLEVLRAAGLIRPGAGIVTIADRPGLEAAACECYRLVRSECDRLFGN